MGRSGEDFLSPSIQADTMRSAAERAGHTVKSVWQDIDVSGRSMNRPGLQAAMASARAGDISVLWVYDLSRFARNAAEGLTELAAIEKVGVEVLSATETLDRSTPTGKLSAGLLLLMAEMKSDQIGEQWRRVHQANAERGVWHGGVPAGYVRLGRRDIAPCPVEGPLWTEVFRRYAAGEGLRSLAQWMSSARGVTVQPSHLSRSLRKVAYLGVVTKDGREYPGRHEALVDQETFDRVQVRLEENALVHSRVKGAAHAFAGLVRCGLCGGAANKRPQRGRDPCLFCRTSVHNPAACPGIGWPSLTPVEGTVLRMLAERVATFADTSAAQADAEAARRARAVSDARTLADELAMTEKALGSLAVHLARGVLSPTAYAAASQELEQSLAVLKGRAAETQRAQVAPVFHEAASLGRALLDLWPSMSSAERNEATRTLVSKVLVAPAVKRGSKARRVLQVVWTDGTSTSSDSLT
ncbi:MAG: cassette chromosome recombinase [Thermoleophilia bacterium]|nr:cassette chromosome recombinase [Thermoleophilia bacterium]